MKLDKKLVACTSKSYLLLNGAWGLASGILLIGQAWLLATIINQVFLQKADLSEVGLTLAGLAALMSGRIILGWLGEHWAIAATASVKSSLRQKLLAKLGLLGPAYTRQEQSGELSATFTEGIESLDAYFSQYLPQLFITALVPPLILVSVWSADWLSGLVLLITAPLLPFFMALIGMFTEKQTRKQWQALSFLSAHFLDVLQGLTTLKLLGRSKIQAATIERVSDRFRRTTLDILKIAFLSSLVMELGATLSTAIVAVEIGFRLLYAQIEFQPTLFVLLLAPEFYLPLRLLGQKYHAGQSGRAAAERIFEILEKPAIEVPAEKFSLAPEALARQIKVSPIFFENVSYSYPAKEGDETRPALDKITFSLAPGQKVALVGPSGSGKSTLANLLLRFSEPSGGQIKLGDKLLSKINPNDWREIIAWVSQKPYLFNTSVLENIRLGRPAATIEEVQAAAKAACAHEFIKALPDGYATVIGERGVRLSGGQVQRLALARAFLKNAPLVILDEATSFLDGATESQVLEATARLLQGRTALIIAHRLATVQQADLIITLDSGQIREIGTPEKLLSNANLYAQLVAAETREVLNV